jgi:hypothetical protein
VNVRDSVIDIHSRRSPNRLGHLIAGAAREKPGAHRKGTGDLNAEFRCERGRKAQSPIQPAARQYRWLGTAEGKIAP